MRRRTFLKGIGAALVTLQMGVGFGRAETEVVTYGTGPGLQALETMRDLNKEKSEALRKYYGRPML